MYDTCVLIVLYTNQLYKRYGYETDNVTSCIEGMGMRLLICKAQFSFDY